MSRARTMMCAALLLTLSVPASAQSNYIGQLLPVAFNFCPRGSLPADGRVLLISEYLPLFSLIGNAYAGDATSRFQLPDLRGRVPIGQTVALSADWRIPEARYIGTMGGNQYQRIDLPPKSADSKPVDIAGAPYLAINWCIVIEGVFPPRP